MHPSAPHPNAPANTPGARPGAGPGAEAVPGSLLVIGGGGHAWVVTEAARAQGWRVIGFLDDDAAAAIDDHTPRLGAIVRGVPVPMGPGDAPPHTIIAIGSLGTRKRLIGEMTGLYAVVVHPTAIVSPSAKLGAGTFVGALAVVQGRATIGEHAIINTGAIVEHDCVIGPNAHIAPRATIGGGVRIGAGTLVGIGASIRPNVRIGAGCTIGVGAAVVGDVPDRATVVGVPARRSEIWSEGDGG